MVVFRNYLVAFRNFSCATHIWKLPYLTFRNYSYAWGGVGCGSVRTTCVLRWCRLWGGVGCRKRWIRQRLATDSAVGVPLIQGSMVDDHWLEGHGRCWALGKASLHAPRIPCGILYMSQRSVHWLRSHHLKLPGLQSMHLFHDRNNCGK